MKLVDVILHLYMFGYQYDHVQYYWAPTDLVMLQHGRQHLGSARDISLTLLKLADRNGPTVYWDSVWWLNSRESVSIVWTRFYIGLYAVLDYFWTTKVDTIKL